MCMAITAMLGDEPENFLVRQLNSTMTSVTHKISCLQMH
jgi:hypothetical protein